jgi:hypothetical protein
MLNAVRTSINKELRFRGSVIAIAMLALFAGNLLAASRTNVPARQDAPSICAMNVPTDAMIGPGAHPVIGDFGAGEGFAEFPAVATASATRAQRVEAR